MSAHIYVTGNLGDTPVVKFTPSGTAALDLSIGCTPRRKDKNSGEWVDDGDPLWIRATLWAETAEAVAEMNLQRGARVSVEGTLKRRTYERNDGTRGESLELASARFLGAAPRGRRSDAPNPSQTAFSGAQGPQQHSGGGSAPNGPQASAQDTWRGGQQGAFTDQYPSDPPF